MKARLFITCLFLLWPLMTRGHVGSPNVFFEGEAGPYPVRIVIRPPAVLPGVAQVDVRVAVNGATNVSLQAVAWDTGVEAAPAPVPALAVTGGDNLFNAALWLMRSGSYSVRVTVAGPLGSGTAAVPLNSSALKRPAMPQSLGVILLVLGILLFLGVGWLAGAAARESALPTGQTPARRDIVRGRWVTGGSLVLVAGAIYAGTVRWQSMDREFRNNALYKPSPVTATVRTNGTIRVLQLEPLRDEPSMAGWDTLVADHGKLMHLFLVREPNFDAFAHLHPVRRDARNFEAVIPSLPAGIYRLYSEITRENGLSETLTASLPVEASISQVPQLAVGSNMLNEAFCSPAVLVGNSPQPFALDMDDSWHIGRASGRSTASQPSTSRLMGGCSMLFQNANDLVENQDASLRFLVFGPDGRPVKLQPYMGMLGHAVVRRSDGEVFTHLHPLGTISMAAGEMLLRRELAAGATNMFQTNAIIGAILNRTTDSSADGGNEVTFPYAFPRPGDYRLWVQIRTSKQVLTGVFDVQVKPAGLRAGVR